MNQARVATNVFLIAAMCTMSACAGDNPQMPSAATQSSSAPTATSAPLQGSTSSTSDPSKNSDFNSVTQNNNSTPNSASTVNTATTTQPVGTTTMVDPPLTSPPSVPNTLEWSLIDQRTDPSGSCMASFTTDLAANGFPNGVYGMPCTSAGQMINIHWGTSNNALNYFTHQPNTCAPGFGPTAINTYVCVYCPSGHWADQAYVINNGDINFQGAYQGVMHRVCLP